MPKKNKKTTKTPTVEVDFCSRETGKKWFTCKFPKAEWDQYQQVAMERFVENAIDNALSNPEALAESIKERK